MTTRTPIEQKYMHDLILRAVTNAGSSNDCPSGNVRGGRRPSHNLRSDPGLQAGSEARASEEPVLPPTGDPSHFKA